MGVIAAYRRVLANPSLARLLIGEFVSSIGDWLYLVALLVLVWQVTSDPLILGIIGAARILPYVLLSVPAGIVADRFDRRMILIITDVARGVIMLLIVGVVLVDGPIELVVGLAILATCFSAFFSPAIGSYLPALVRDETELGPANSAWSSLDNLAFFIGPGIAALLLNLGDVALAFLINAFTFGFVALVLWQLPPGRPRAAAGADQPDTDQAETGLARPAISLRSLGRPLVGLGLLNVVDGFVFGGLSVLTIVLAVQLFGVDEATGTGLLNSAIGVGGVAGALIAGTFVLRRRLGLLMMSGAIAFGAGVAAMGQVGDRFGLALIAMAIASAGALVAEIVAQTLLQRIVPDAARGRALGAMQTVTVAAYAAGAFIVPIVGAVEPQGVLLASGTAMVLAGIGAALLLGQYGLQQPALAPDARLLAEVPMFAGLPPASLERAMSGAAVRQMMAGEVLIRQGEPADYFYLIVEGEVEVTQRASPATADERFLRRMGTREFFGEIGLLSGVPRTATVRAATDGRLVTLDREAFLALVSAGSGLTHRLLAMHRGTISAGDA